MLARTTMTAVAALAMTLGGCTTTTAAEGGVAGAGNGLSADAAYIQAAVDNPARPEDQVADDANRKPAEMLAFAGVEPGDKIGELIPGGGYFTRIFSGAVGAEGAVYTFTSARGADTVRAIAEDPAFSNVVYVEGSVTDISSPEPLDLVWTSQNYHDLRQGRDTLNASIYEALKPGGHYVVLDHSAEDGSGYGAVEAGLHRIDQAFVRAEVEAAGFEYVGESDALRNPDDARNVGPFDPSIRGRTDQFVMLFVKPEM
ncbi:MAG: methyltransferase domain-containing protein [Maricaulaceae bacterium]|jgi:predicted methyltransferase